MAKNKNIFVTITGFQHYYGREPFQIGNLIRCAKEPGNPYDSDAIRAFLPYIGKVGARSKLRYVILDKNVTVKPDTKLQCTPEHPLYISKGVTV